MSSMFADLTSRARKASDLALTDVAEQLTGMFRDHLYQHGVPVNEIKSCSIVHDPESSRFVPDITPRVSEMDLGSPTSPPMGLVVKFFNRINVPKMHNAALYAASKKVGLL